jgi:hypothetical protein
LVRKALRRRRRQVLQPGRALELLLAQVRSKAVLDPYGLFAFTDFQFVDAGLFQQFDQFLDFTDIH